MIRIAKNKSLKQLLSALMVVAMLCLSLPCNCMAEPVQETSHSEEVPPCHSSPDTQKQSDDSEQHQNCCCTDACVSATVDSTSYKLLASEVQNHKIKINLTSLNGFNDTSYLIDSLGLIRGSPPTFDVSYTNTKTYLAFVQRWLI